MLMTDPVKTLAKFLKETGHDEDADAFLAVDWYITEFVKTSDELAPSAKKLQRRLLAVLKKWA